MFKFDLRWPWPRFFYEKNNWALLEKELDYLESIGMRLIRIDLVYVRYGDIYEISQEEKVYKSILDLIYQHKMLLVAEIIGKVCPDLTTWKTRIFHGT